MKVTIIVSIVILLFCLSPFVTIWAINTLFGLGIQSTLATWFATLWFTGMLTLKLSGAAVKQ